MFAPQRKKYIPLLGGVWLSALKLHGSAHNLIQMLEHVLYMKECSFAKWIYTFYLVKEKVRLIKFVGQGQ